MTMKKVVRIIGRMNGGGPARQVAYLHHSLRGRFETILVVGAIEPGEQDMRYLLIAAPTVAPRPGTTSPGWPHPTVCTVMRLISRFERYRSSSRWRSNPSL